MDAWSPWIALVSTVLAGLFSTLYMALADLGRSRLEELAAVSGSPSRQRRARAILDDVTAHARAMALPRLVFNLLAAGAIIAAVVGPTDAEGRIPLIDLALGLALASGALWISAVAIPMSIATHAGERVVFGLSWLVRGVYILERPLAPAAGFLDEVVRRLAGEDHRTDAEEIEAELMSVIEEGEREGSLDEVERDMIERVVEFKSTTVEQIMTPRTEINAIEYTDEVNDVIRLVREIGHSRIPVYERDLDHIAGILYAKDLLAHLGGGAPGPFDLRPMLRPALFVPETKTVRELLKELLDKKLHIALVADEYGGTSGLVTLEDIVEEIFGEIRDEYEPPEEDTPEVAVDESSRSALVDARAYIDDVNEGLKALGVEVPESEDYDTVGGFVVTRLGRIPDEGESFRFDRALVVVVEAEPTRVKRLRFEIRPEENGEPGEPDSSEDGEREAAATRT